jgi:hypothetical protein
VHPFNKTYLTFLGIATALVGIFYLIKSWIAPNGASIEIVILLSLLYFGSYYSLFLITYPNRKQFLSKVTCVLEGLWKNKARWTDVETE